jgi:bifunctional DNA-binding transcriptional regulator/antitoxin component of YhaV-PrlF toxin-antitoxin module
MKILKEKSREYKGQKYFKYKVNIPQIDLMKANLKDGDELEITATKDTLLLKKVQKQA